MQLKALLIVIISTLIYLTDSSRSDEITVHGAARLERATPNEFSAIIEQMSSVARIVSAVSLQNGLIDKTIPPNDALAELLKIGAVDVEKLKSFKKKNVENALTALDQLGPDLISTADGDKLEAMIILLDSWRQKHEKVGDVKNTKLAKVYYAAVEDSQQKTLNCDVFEVNLGEYIEHFASILDSTKKSHDQDNKRRLNSLIDIVNVAENFGTKLSDCLASLRQFDDLTRRDFVVDSPQRHYIDLLNVINATKSSIVGNSGSSAAQTEIANTAGKVHTAFSETSSTDLFHLAEIVSSQSHYGQKSRKYTSGLLNGYLDLEKLDDDVLNPAMKPLLGTFSPADLQSGLALLKTLTKDAIDLHQAWSPLNKSESVNAKKQLVSLTRWFGALKSPITSVTVTAAASFGGKPVPPVSFSSDFAKSIEKSVKLRSTLLSVRQKTEVLQNLPSMGNLTLISEMKKFLPNSTITDVTKVPQLMSEFKKFKNAQKLFNALNDTKPMIEGIYNDLASVDIIQTIKGIAGGQKVLEDFLKHSDAGTVNNYLTELTNSEVKSVAETVQLVQQIRVFTKKTTFDQQVLTMSDVILPSIPKVKSLIDAIKTIVTDKNPDATKLKELKISEEDSKNFGDAVMLVKNFKKFLEKERDFEKVLANGSRVVPIIHWEDDPVKRQKLLDGWGDFDETNKTVKLTFADMKTRINSISTSSISKFVDYGHVFNAFNGLRDLNLEVESRGTVLAELGKKFDVMLDLKTDLEKLDSMDLHFASSSASLSLLPQTLASLDKAFNFVAQKQALVTPIPILNPTLKPNASSVQMTPTSSSSSSIFSTILPIILGLVVFVIVAVAVGYGIRRFFVARNKKYKKGKDIVSIEDGKSSEPTKVSGKTEIKVDEEDETTEQNGSHESADLPVPNEIVKSNEAAKLKEAVKPNETVKPNVPDKLNEIVKSNEASKSNDAAKSKETKEPEKSDKKNVSNEMTAARKLAVNMKYTEERISQEQEKQKKRYDNWIKKKFAILARTLIRFPLSALVKLYAETRQVSQEQKKIHEERHTEMSTMWEEIKRTEPKKGIDENRPPLMSKNKKLPLREFVPIKLPSNFFYPIGPEEFDKLKLDELLAALLTSGGMKTIEFNTFQLNTLLNLAVNTFKTTNRPLLEFDAPFHAVGDLHGRFHALLLYFKECGLPPDEKYLFLGDYVDRGKHALEVIILLLILRIVYPDQIMLIRGNHEMTEVNDRHQLREECVKRFGDKEGERMFDKFNEVFSWMPLAAYVSKTAICMHGGISEDLNSLDDIRNIQLPVAVMPENRKGLVPDLLWADPHPLVKEFKPNILRGISVYFGENQLDNVLKKLNAKVCLRGHQVAPEGVMCFWDGKLVTIFSAPNYHKSNYGAILSFNKEFEPSILQVKLDGTADPQIPDIDEAPSTRMD